MRRREVEGEVEVEGVGSRERRGGTNGYQTIGLTRKTQKYQKEYIRKKKKEKRKEKKRKGRLMDL